MTDAGYVCSLDEASLRKARKELNEDPKDRLASVAALRDWIHRQREWMTSPTGRCQVRSMIYMYNKIASLVMSACTERLIHELKARGLSIRIGTEYKVSLTPH